MRNIAGKVVLLTGANGGIGGALLEELVQRGVKKVYATGLEMIDLKLLQAKYPEIVVPVELDVTNLAAIQACHKACDDTDILINNAGVEFATRFIGNKSLKAAQIEMQVNYFGVHHMCAVFWDSLLARSESSIVNMLSVASFTHIPQLATYCASKAAAHVLTRSLRKESEGTSLMVHGIYPGYVDTKMTKNIADVKKVTPELIAIETCNGLEQGVLDVFPDDMAKQFSWKISTPIQTDVAEDTAPQGVLAMFTPVEKPFPSQ